jgi:hypothetical protein
MGRVLRFLPPRYRKRRSFSALRGLVVFGVVGGWYDLHGSGRGISFLAGILSGITAFLFFWYVFSRAGTGFDD